MKPLDVRVARQSAKAKGFEQVSGPSDHDYYWYLRSGKKTRFRVKISHGAREMLPRELRANAKQCSMDPADFRKVLSCEHDAAWVKTYFDGLPPNP